MTIGTSRPPRLLLQTVLCASRFLRLFALSALALTLGFTNPAHAATLAIRDVRVIDGTGASPIPRATVLVDQGRIVAVGDVDAVDIPDGAVVIDGAGLTLLPGFVDTHVHLTLGPVGLEIVDGTPTPSIRPLPGGPERSLRLLLAHGITTVRDPGGPTEDAVAMRNALNRGELLGPRAVVAGRILDPTPLPSLIDPVSTPEEVVNAVRQQAAAGVDFVKLYTGLGPELIAVAVAEAHKLNLPAVGHLEATTWAEAAALGIDGIVHIVPGSAELLPEQWRASYRAKPGGLAFPAWFNWVDLDAPAIRETIGVLARERVHLDPTLVVFEHAFFGDIPRFAENAPGLELAHPALVANWKDFFTFNLGWSAEDFDTARRVWPKVLSFTRRLWEGGVMLSAGTDANNPWVVPGVSFHRELELLVAAGIPHSEVLKIGTRNGAEVVGLLAETGTISPGKRADLVLVDGDPLLDISATRRIVWVMKDGQLYDPRDLLSDLGR